MDLGSVLLILALALLVGVLLSRPWMDARFSNREELSQKPENEVENQRLEMQAERERLLNALVELDRDAEVGKILAEDYQVERNTLLAAGAKLLQQLDQLDQPSQQSLTNPVVISAAPSTSEDDQIEALIIARGRQKKEKAAGYCPKCGNLLQASDQYCSRCGRPTS
jgi:uncharacterized membrane-anchored protein YhcB (DUF1043 family)